MSDFSTPRSYTEWPTQALDRAEDAANTFGYYLITHCRDKALAKLPLDDPDDIRSKVTEAVDLALHNVMDMIEGYWPLSAGAKNHIECVLAIRVLSDDGNVTETIEISPNKLGLPIGYWKWSQDREFR